jgi:Ran-binding protein 3
MAYASTESPFASVKGQNIFASSPKSPTPSTSAALPSVTPAKRNAFDSFAVASSPFATFGRSEANAFGRAKSPSRKPNSTVGTNAFSAWSSGGAQGFALPAQKRARASSPETSTGTSTPAVPALDAKESAPATTFGEKLRAETDQPPDEDEKPKLDLKAQDGGFYCGFHSI